MSLRHKAANVIRAYFFFATTSTTQSSAASDVKTVEAAISRRIVAI
jgi:hypothetical protein